MSAGRDPHLSNRLPRVAVAVHLHRVYRARKETQRAQSALRLAERQATAAGINLRAARTLDEMASRGADWVQQQQNDMFEYAEAIGFGVRAERPASVEVTTDVSEAEHRLEIYAQGYHAGYRDDAREPHYFTEDDDRAAWLEGYDAFAADKAAFEAQEAAAREARKPGRIAA